MIATATTALTATDKLKYKHPIPNRDVIRGLLNRSKKHLSRTQLAKSMSLSLPQEREALRRRLNAMARDGEIHFEPKKGYSTAQSSELISGRVIGHPDGYGFLVRDDEGEDIRLNERQMLPIFDGDRVQVRITGQDNRGRSQVHLNKVLEHNTKQLVGLLHCDEGQYYIKAQNKRISHEIDIHLSQLAQATAGQFVVVEITDYPDHRYNAYGKVIEVLGDAHQAGMETEVVMREMGIPHVFPDSVTEEANKAGEIPSESDISVRFDMRHLPFVTIDGADAKDFDDAVYCEPQKDGSWHLYVAIADVSHYVKPDSAMDKEAHLRGTSVYFPDQVVPMLPERLSNGLCSLNPSVDRLALVCEMHINQQGNMTHYCFSEAVIHSHGRLTYNEVNDLLTKRKNNRYTLSLRKKFASVLPHLESLHSLYSVLQKARSWRGAIEFDSAESAFQFDQHRKIVGVVPIERNDAHRLIEECMLCANVAAATFLKSTKQATLYRNHYGPQTKKLDMLRRFLTTKGLTLTGGDNPSSKDYQQLLASVAHRSDVAAIQSMLLRSLSQAEYSPQNSGHFGLAFEGYTHFTSPIRRYPDLITHRAIRSQIRAKRNGAMHHLLSAFGMKKSASVKKPESVKCEPVKMNYPYKKQEMAALAEHCSEQARRADKASREVESWLKCLFLQDAIGETFEGVVTSVTHFGLFIELCDTKIEGLLHIKDLGNDYYRFDENNLRLTGERHQQHYTLGNRIQVKIAQVDMNQKKIGFLPSH